MTTAQAARPGQQTSDGARTASGSLLVTGFAVLMVQVVLFAINEGWLPIAASVETRRWDAALACAGVTVTLMGLAVFETVLSRAGDAVGGRIGLVAYGLAAGAWVVGQALEYTAAGFVAPLGYYFIVASGVSVLAFATAALRTSALPRWAGWVALAWSGSWLIRFAFPLDTFAPPYVHQAALLLFGVLLLRGGRPRPVTTSS